MPGGAIQTPAVRSALKIFSTRAFRPLLAHGASVELDDAVARLRPELGLAPHSSNGTVIEAAYGLLTSSYRSEYVYKNLIANKVFVGRHRAANSVLLNEFRVGAAVADSVLVNGAATVYEIKTELDNPDKLERQIAEYHQAFPIVNVVVAEKMASRYENLLRNTSAGLVSVGSRWRLSTVKQAEETIEHLSIRTMFNALRTREVESMLGSLGFQLPQVPNGIRYERYLELAMSAEILSFHDAFRRALKGRKLSGDMSLYRDPRLFALRTLLVQLNPNRAEGKNLLAWLSIR